MAIPTNDLLRPADAGAQVLRPSAVDPSTIIAEGNSKWRYVHWQGRQGSYSVETIHAGHGVPDEDVGTWWLPVLDIDIVRAGVNGHRTPSGPSREAAAEASKYADERIARLRGIVLDPIEHGYLASRPCRNDRNNAVSTYWYSVFESPEATMPGKRTKFSMDRQRFARWRLSLVRSGALPGPDPRLVDLRLGQLAQRVVRQEQLAGALPSEMLARRVAAATEPLTLAQAAERPEAHA